MKLLEFRQMFNIIMYTDGNIGGYAAILLCKNKQKVLFGPTELTTNVRQQDTTNSRGEMMAAIQGLEAIKKPSLVVIHSDSEFMCKSWNLWLQGWIRRGWKRNNGGRVANKDLWKRMIAASKSHNVSFQHVRGHANIELNEVADIYATLGKETGIHRSDCLL